MTQPCPICLFSTSAWPFLPSPFSAAALLYSSTDRSPKVTGCLTHVAPLWMLVTFSGMNNFNSTFRHPVNSSLSFQAQLSIHLVTNHCRPLPQVRVSLGFFCHPVLTKLLSHRLGEVLQAPLQPETPPLSHPPPWPDKYEQVKKGSSFHDLL